MKSHAIDAAIGQPSTRKRVARSESLDAASPHAAAGLAVLALGIAFATGPDWDVILGLAVIGAMMLARLLLVEIPRDRRGERPT